MHFTKMIDMARDTKEVKEDVAAISPAVPRYNYGLCLALTEEELDKLKIDELPAVGDTIHLCAFAKVTSVSENECETADGQKEKRCRVELQITQLATESEDDEHEEIETKEKARRGRFYGDGEETAAS